jgi:archaellum component FlaF (FlaF/FlaG flagellin family)
MLKLKVNKFKYLSLLMSLLGISLLASGCLFLSCSGMISSEVTIPIKVENAANAGSFHFEVIYDTSNLKVTRVEQGQLASGSLFDYNMDNPGQVIFGIANSGGINGNGELAIIDFKVTGPEKTSIPINLENVFVFNATSLEPITIDTHSGSTTPEGTLSQTPSIVFVPE